MVPESGPRVEIARTQRPEKKPDPPKIKRLFTKPGESPFTEVDWEFRTAKIADSNGNAVFEQTHVQAPVFWSQLATDIVASKYFRGAPGSSTRETSIAQVIARVVDAITESGLKQGYFDNPEDAEVFHAELTYIILHQLGTFNSPVWFNVGAVQSPQVSACFTMPVEDTMESIMALARNEAMIFKGGSGTGTNLSALRSSKEGLSGGGTASGPISFMRVFDAVTGVVKSGGRSRRAAKLVMLDVDHPDIIEFINCKGREEKKAWALIDAGYDGSIDGEAYATVNFQNSNNSVRIPDDFMQAVLCDGTWNTIARTTGEVMSTHRARDLLAEIAKAAHACGDPGVQFDTTINKFNTCKNSGRINCSNACQPAFATVLTPGGIRTIGEVLIGDRIWSNGCWTTVMNKWSTGTKEVFKFQTRVGAFIGTKDHRVVEYGEKVEAQHASAVDRCDGPPADVNTSNLDSMDVLDGLVIGDGRVKSCHGGTLRYVLLTVGEKDKVYLDDPTLRDLIATKPFDSTEYRTQTTITADELPKTYDRRIPDRFFRGDQRKVRGFLRGLFSANGTISGNRVCLKATSFKVIEQVQQMLSFLGISSYYSINKAHDIEFPNGIYTTKQSYDANITTDRSRFRDLIGFIHPEKNARLDEACKTGPRVGGYSKQTYEVTEVESLGEHEVFDLTVDCAAHTYWTGGLLVSNCGELQFLDNSSCNLASINLLPFLANDGSFKIQEFEHAVDVFITAQDILIDMASYPTKDIGETSKKFRPLGINYTNLGALLMAMGLPYDSPDGRETAASITALMTGRAYRRSAELAQQLGAFDGYKENRESMLGVIDLHVDAVRQLRDDVKDVGSDTTIIAKAWDIWQDAKLLGRAVGFRNAQASLLAPTGTISFMMDCDTTGVEPEFSLVKTKNLVGGGSIRTVNKTIPRALNRLGYSDDETTEILAYIEASGTVEGMPLLDAKHLPVFDCAATPPNGTRSIAPMGHIDMVAAVQPFLSGAISKTINLPNNIDPEQIVDLYTKAWQKGIKAMAVYRDGSKRIQPLQTRDAPAKPEVVNPDIIPTARRRRLPRDRVSATHKFSISGYEGYVTIGQYEDGTPGEMFIRMAKAGSVISGLMDGFALSISMALQYGVPLEVLCEKYTHTRFEPSGFTTNPEIPMTTSILDYIFRWIASRYLKNDEEVMPGVPQPVQQRLTDIGYLGKSHPNEMDGPACPKCGAIMVRSGTCHTCRSCGTSGGCG
jgi:ribonucleoside-diphosphate reductase alpha chain